mgnify:CR=1 FL=1
MERVSNRCIITLEIIHNGLRSITDESFIALMKSAYSTNIKERGDCSTAIFGANAETIAHDLGHRKYTVQAVAARDLRGAVEQIRTGLRALSRLTRSPRRPEGRGK